MKREGFWRYATPPVNIRGVPLPFTMIYLFICPFLQNNLLDLHRHHFIFRHSRPFRLDCQDDLYSHFQHSERGHRLRSSMVVSPPYGITTRLDWPRLNSGVFMSGKTIVTLLRVSLLACPLLFTTPSFAMIDTPSVKVGFSPEGSASALVLDTINSAESSIRMMAYSFTDPDVMHALAKAKNAEWTSVLLLMTRGIRTGQVRKR